MKPSPTVTLEALKMLGGGVCLGHAQGSTWMITGALPGEHVHVEEIRRRAGVIEARTIEVISNRHPARLEEPCPHAGPCGGCDWPHVDLDIGSRLKAEAAAETARGRPEIAAALRAAPVKTSPPSYRLRARLHWDLDTSSLGFFARRSNRIHPLSECRVVSPRLLKAVPEISSALARHRIPTCDFEWLENLDGSQAIGALVGLDATNNDSFKLLPSRADLENTVDGFFLITRNGDTIGGWGLDAVEMDTPIPLHVPPGAFFQGNKHLVNWLFRRVADLAGPDPAPTWDLHAGVGFLAAAVQWAGPRKLVLVEPNRVAARAATENLAEARVEVGETAEHYLHTRRSLPPQALVVTDPPRTGLSKGVRRHLVSWKPARILMLACDPATWVRDTGALIDQGYRLGHVELVDLFPSTHHVEILAVLERR